MARTIFKLLIISSLLSAWNISQLSAQVPDGTVKVTTKLVSTDVGLSWGEGVLTYKGRDYPFTFNAKGLVRHVNPNITAAELSDPVFNLKNPLILLGTCSERVR